MARSRRRWSATVSLFPFLSVLACVLGTLTLLITVLALGQMQSAVPEWARLASAQGQISADTHEIDELTRLIEEARSVLDQIQRAREELALLQDKRVDPGTSKELNTELLSQANLLRKRIEQLERELAQLQELIKQLEAERAARNKPLEAAAIVLQPSGSGVNLRPGFAECTSTGLVLYSGTGAQRTRTRVRTDDIDSSADFGRFLGEVKSRTNATAIFLIRPDGVAAYDKAMRRVTLMGVRNGKLPLAGMGEIDFSLFPES